MRKRILIVDHNNPMRSLMKIEIEKKSGLEVCGEADEGPHGIQQGIALRPDLIVMDFAMPRMNGLQAAAILHHALPDAKIVLFTLHSELISNRMAHDAGVSAVLSKWHQLSTLGDEVQKFVVS
jgi:DNA-binding NarL/FixJ family response regulator